MQSLLFELFFINMYYFQNFRKRKNTNTSK